MTPTDPFSPPQSDWPPAVTVVDITDPTTVDDSIEILDQDVVAPDSRRLRARRVAATDLQPPRSDRTRVAQSRIVKTAEDFALAYVGDRLHVTGLCKATGVSERSLEYAFKEIIGMSPTSYLTRVRLHRVRKALQAATRASTTVSAEALNQGFWHFGEFSRAYRTCFGELPSETLRRATSDTR
jgi:transcriptional regulator GlxA family with amidase domain